MPIRSRSSTDWGTSPIADRWVVSRTGERRRARRCARRSSTPSADIPPERTPDLTSVTLPFTTSTMVPATPRALSADDDPMIADTPSAEPRSSRLVKVASDSERPSGTTSRTRGRMSETVSWPIFFERRISRSPTRESRAVRSPRASCSFVATVRPCAASVLSVLTCGSHRVHLHSSEFGAMTQTASSFGLHCVTTWATTHLMESATVAGLPTNPTTGVRRRSRRNGAPSSVARVAM